MFTFITGGARSGKSRQAEAIAAKYGSVTYIATAQLWDDEMRRRAALHRASRPAHWHTVECSDDVAAAVRDASTQAVLIDCITLWVTALMMPLAADWDHPTAAEAEAADAAVTAHVDALIEAVREKDAHIIAVSNELGMGLVPPYPFGRIFRDVAGRANQRVAAASDNAVLMVAGLPLALKGRIG